MTIEELLPCRCCPTGNNFHVAWCPASYRQNVQPYVDLLSIGKLEDIALLTASLLTAGLVSQSIAEEHHLLAHNLLDFWRAQCPA